MAGEIASAYLAILPSMKSFGSNIVQQGGSQIALAGKQLGEKGGVALGASLGGSAARSAIPAIGQVNAAIAVAQSSSQSWLASTAQMALKNVTLYGSMYAAIQGIQQGVHAVFDAMVGFNAELEQANIGFTTLLGSSAAAQDQMAWIKDFAKESPFRYENLVGYSQQLIALGFNAEESRKVIVAAGDAAAALGRGDEGIARINLALGQMWTKGKVQSQEMLQLTEAGIGAWQILADAYGTSVGEVQDKVTAGLISAKDAVPALIAGMESQFGGLMDAQSKTFVGMFSNIQDTLQQQLAAAGAPLFRELTADAKEFLAALDDPQAVQMMTQLGDGLAAGAHALGDFLKFAWQWRDVILAVGVGYAALKVAASWTATHYSAEAIAARDATMRWREMPAALTGVRAATAENVLAQGRYQVALAASAEAEKAAQTAMQARTVAATAHVAAVDRVIVAERISLSLPFDRAYEARLLAQNALTAASDRETLAIERSVAAKRAALAANEALALSETQVAAASASVTAAQTAQIGAWAKLAPILSTGGLLVGAPLLMDGWSRSVQAATADTEDLGGSVIGMAEAVGGGALAGATLGSILPGVGTAVGAVGGAVIGLVGNLWSMSAAMQAANADTSLAKKALEDYGVEATLASLALNGVTNDQLLAVGGFDAIREAMQSGTYGEYVAGLEKQSAAIREQTVALSEQQIAMRQIADDTGNYTGLADSTDYQAVTDQLGALSDQADSLDRALASLSANGEYLAQTQEQITFSAYEAAYAADIQTGALGRQTDATWQAVVASGGLGAEAIQAALRMEGLAGVAGYVTQMISGIPKGTAINFTTNASDIAGQIIALQAAARAGFSNLNMTADAYERQVTSLKAQYASALSGARVTLALPSSGGGGGGGGGGSSAIDTAAREAEQAARAAAAQLKQDRNTQLQFGDAFGTIMQAALEGNFDQYRDKLEREIVSLTRDGYTAAADTLKRLSGTLTQASLDYAALTNKLKSASGAYDDLTKRMRDQYQTSRDLITGLGKATDAQSFDQLAYLLGETTSKATAYQDVLTQLKDQGLSEGLWKQLAQAGPESAGLAQSILAQGQAGVDQLNSLSGGLLEAADSMGSLVSQSMYQQGVDAMQAYIDGLQSQSTALENQLETIANNVLTKTAGAITPGNAGYAGISAAPQSVVNKFDVSFTADSLGDIKTVQDFIAMLEQAATTQLVNQAGTVTS